METSCAINDLHKERDRARDLLRRDFGIDSAFVRVPDLARVLGLAECTIYAAMRQHRFFIPHRMMLTSPAVKLDDLVEWYCSEGQLGRRGREESEARKDQFARKSADEEVWAALRRSVARR